MASQCIDVGRRSVEEEVEKKRVCAKRVDGNDGPVMAWQMHVRFAWFIGLSMGEHEGFD